MMLGRECMVHPDHEMPVPIQYHHVRPRPRGGGDSQIIQLCANAHGAVHALLEHIEATATTSPFATVDEILRNLPADLWQERPAVERLIAYRGWQMYGLGFLNGRYETAYRLWHTDGIAKLPDVPHFDDIGHAARWSKRWRRELDAL